MNREYLYYECPARPARSDEPLNHAAWRAGDLEPAVMEELRKLAVTGDTGASGRDEVERSGPAQLNALEREFMRRYRMVADGHGRIQTLDSLVDEMSRARGGDATAAVAGDADTVEPRPDRGELLRQAAGDDVELARLALSAMISRLDVGATEIDLTPRA